MLLSIYFRISKILEYQKLLKNDTFNILLYITPGSKEKNINLRKAEGNEHTNISLKNDTFKNISTGQYIN